MLRQFGLYDCKALQNPMETDAKFGVTDGNAIEDVKMDQQMVGNLVYLTITTLDIAFVFRIISRYMQEEHLVAMKWVLRYIKGTLEYKSTLLYFSDKVSPSFFCDENWAGDKETRRSISGYCCSLGNGVVSWLSKKQLTIALSSTEAE